MSTPTPIEPDLLRQLLTQAVAPVQPSPDALREIRTGIRKRRLRLSLGTGAGALLLTGGAVAAVVAIGSAGTPQATVTLEPGQTSTVAAPTTTTVAPTTTAATTTTAAPVVSPTVVPSTSVTVGAGGGTAVVTGVPGVDGAAAGSTSPAAVVTTTSSSATSAVTSIPPTHPAAVPHDVDGDGVADTVTVTYSGATTARLQLHSSTGKVISSAPLRLISGLGAGDLTFFDINGDGAAEVIVPAGGASAQAYELFQYVSGQLMHVPAAGGWLDPFLVSRGGGGSVGAGQSFGCTGGDLVLSGYGSTDPLHFTPGPNQTYTFRTTRFSVTGGRAHVLSSRTDTLLTLAEARSRLAAESDNRCGAPL